MSHRGRDGHSRRRRFFHTFAVISGASLAASSPRAPRRAPRVPRPAPTRAARTDLRAACDVKIGWWGGGGRLARVDSVVWCLFRGRVENLSGKRYHGARITREPSLMGRQQMNNRLHLGQNLKTASPYTRT